MQDFEELYRENADIVYRYLFSLTHSADLAEELTQQTFCEAIAHPGNFRGGTRRFRAICAGSRRIWRRRNSPERPGMTMSPWRMSSTGR